MPKQKIKLYVYNFNVLCENYTKPDFLYTKKDSGSFLLFVFNYFSFKLRINMSKKLSMDELNRINVEEFKQSSKFPLVVVLDNIRSMNNIGSVFRTCDAFRIEKICLCGITAQPPHKDIEKTALGATQSVDWTYFESTTEAVEDLKNENYAIFAVEQTQGSIFLDKFEIRNYSKLALVFGNEVLGVEQEVIDICNGCIEIPQFGTKHSLNISVSAGIVLWQMMYLLSKS